MSLSPKENEKELNREALINSDAELSENSEDKTPPTPFDLKFDEYCKEWEHLERNDKIRAFMFFSKEFSKQFLPVAFIFVI